MLDLTLAAAPQDPFRRSLCIPILYAVGSINALNKCTVQSGLVSYKLLRCEERGLEPQAYAQAIC